MSITITSSAFESGKTIPKKHTGDGEDVSPALKWSNPPPGTKELALIVDDPDAPTPEPWLHWILVKIPATVTSLREGIGPQDKPEGAPDAIQGKNSFGKFGYGGPAPPRGHGIHHYRFHLYALDQSLDLKGPPEVKSLNAQMEGHILAEGELVGTYQR
jgi:Raf kinase inhibitor-like YbhB/YbcL family protein